MPLFYIQLFNVIPLIVILANAVLLRVVAPFLLTSDIDRSLPLLFLTIGNFSDALFNKTFFTIYTLVLKSCGILHFHPSLTFESQVGAHSSGVHAINKARMVGRNGKESTVNRALGGSTYPG